MWKYLFENFFIIFMVFFILTQMIYPAFSHKIPFFWWFRPKRKKKQTKNNTPNPPGDTSEENPKQ